MVWERIRSDIIDGTLPPGTQLNEVELASQLRGEPGAGAARFYSG